MVVGRFKKKGNKGGNKAFARMKVQGVRGLIMFFNHYARNH